MGLYIWKRGSMQYPTPNNNDDSNSQTYPNYTYQQYPPKQQQPSPQKPPQSKPPKWAMGCAYLLMIVVALSLCIGGIHVAQGLSSVRAVVATAPATFSSGQNTLARSSTTPIQSQPTSAPTAKPTPTSKPTPKPTPRLTQPPIQPTQKPAPTQAPVTGVNGNPWGYNFTPGNYIYSPPLAFCSYFDCIKSFWESTKGYVDECVDGTYSHSGGRSGDCSDHGGEKRPLYSH